MKKAKKPKSRNDKDSTTPGADETFRDGIRLVNKLLQICSKGKIEVVLATPAYLAKSDPYWAGYDYPETITMLMLPVSLFRWNSPHKNDRAVIEENYY